MQKRLDVKKIDYDVFYFIINHTIYKRRNVTNRGGNPLNL
jgi:hypothetical protein